MTETDTSKETRIQRNWTKSFALVGLCACLFPIFVYGTQIEPQGFYDRRFHSGSFVAAPAFLVLGVVALYRLVIPWGPPVRISPSGFVDLRAGREVIPWHEISNVVRRGEFVSLTLKRKFAKSYSLSMTQKVLKATRKSAGPTHLLVADWYLAAGPTEMTNIISAYWEEYSGKAPS